MDFVKLLNEEIDECQGLEGVFDTSRLIYGMKDFAGVRSLCVPRWKDRARRLFPAWNSTTVAAVDLNSIFHAAHEVQPDDAEKLSLGMLRKIYKELSPTIFVACADCRAGVDKKQKHPQYKSSRPEKPDGYREQLDATIDTLRAKICVEEHSGMEADDCLATIAFQCALLGSKCVLVANDKDLWQCLFSGVAMYDRTTKAYKNHDWLVANHRIRRDQVVDWLCMVGNKNDMPGVEGVGMKTASDWLQAYGDFIGAMNATKNSKMEEFFEKHYWATREAHTLCVGVNVRWYTP